MVFVGVYLPELAMRQDSHFLPTLEGTEIPKYQKGCYSGREGGREGEREGEREQEGGREGGR